MGRLSLVRLATLASVAALAIGACGGGTGTATPSSVKPTVAPSVAPTERPPVVILPLYPTAHIVVQWFVGLGPGTNPDQMALEQQVVSDFNALQDKRTDGIEPTLLSFQVVQNNLATDILKTEIAANQPPDLIGPLRIEDMAGLSGTFLDMTPLIQATGYDMSQYPPAVLNTMRDPRTGALLGLPYAVYPSYIFYNKDLFDAAGLSYPPTKVGDKYTLDGKQVDWNWDTVRTLAMRLSFDETGRIADQPSFDPTSQVQFGFEFQDTEGRALGSAFGSGSFVAPDGRTAQSPDAWKAAWSWYYNGIWTDHFIATDAERNSDLLAWGNPIASGHVAMGYMSQRYTCCMLGDTSLANALGKHWDIAPMPANSAGVTTAPVDMDTFAIYKNSPAPDRAFEAMTYIMNRMDLLAAYGGTPATGDRLKFFHDNVDPQLARQFPGNKVNWQVAVDMEAYAEVPNHQAELSNNTKAVADYNRVFSTLAATKSLNMNAVFRRVTTALQADFNAAT